MKAKVNTKSNYRNLNEQWLEVKEIVGTRVTCIVETEEYGKQSVDFNLKEITEMDTTGGEGFPSLHPVFENIMSTAGRKPIADKKERIVLFAEQSLIELNGGQDICKRELYLYLKERGGKLKKVL